MDINIFNVNAKPNDDKASLFLEEPRGLFDSVNRPHPELHELYKKLKKLDWDEHEFPLEKCRTEFKSAPKSIVEKMVSTIAWQWEADSIVAHSIAGLMYAFVTNEEAWSAYVEINKNEILHALSYSEIVKYGMEDPTRVMQEIHENRQVFARMKAVGDALGFVRKVAGKLLTGQMERDDPEARKAALLAVGTILILERVQFMPSFAVTFAIGGLGQFMPAVDTIQKIMTDEFTVHIPVGKYILAHEWSVPKSAAVLRELKPKFEAILHDVEKAELAWNRQRFQESEELPGLTLEMLDDWMYFGSTDVRYVLQLGFENTKVVETNPIPSMQKWVNINTNQSTPQEKRSGNYLLGGIVQSAEKIDFSLDDL